MVSHCNISNLPQLCLFIFELLGSSSYTYNQNSSMTYLERVDETGTSSEQFMYYATVDGEKTNRLDWSYDGSNTIDYSYDNMGNVTIITPLDPSIGSNTITWTSDGKIDRVERSLTFTKNDNTVSSSPYYIQFLYDGMGNRIAKIRTGQDAYGASNTNALVTAAAEFDALLMREKLKEYGEYTTLYGREAGGKVLAKYEVSYDMIEDYISDAFVDLDEWHIYGSGSDGRITSVLPHGTELEDLASSSYTASPDGFASNSFVSSAITGSWQKRQRHMGLRNYELKDHLGNVRAVISDIKEPDNYTTFEPFTADVRNISNYYPYGKPLPTGDYSVDSDYNYGFNGMEKDDSTRGKGSNYDFGARIYNTDQAMFLSRDPLERKYASMSPYSSFGSNPILHVDPDGKDYAVKINHSTKTIIVKATYYTVKDDAESTASARNATKAWNDKSGMFEYETSGGDVYDIQFNLDVKEVDSPGTELNNDKDNNQFDGKLPQKTKDGSSNVYQTKSDTDPIFQKKGVAAVTENQYRISTKESSENLPAANAHEMGHTLGLKHADGFMKEKLSRQEAKSESIELNAGHVGQILNNAGVGNGGLDNGVMLNQPEIKSKGLESKGFKTGKVREKTDKKDE